jgi:hypothetical protein
MRALASALLLAAVASAPLICIKLPFADCDIRW